jgi:hypothetical protein
MSVRSSPSDGRCDNFGCWVISRRPCRGDRGIHPRPHRGGARPAAGPSRSRLGKGFTHPVVSGRRGTISHFVINARCLPSACRDRRMLRSRPDGTCTENGVTGFAGMGWSRRRRCRNIARWAAGRSPHQAMPHCASRRMLSLPSRAAETLPSRTSPPFRRFRVTPIPGGRRR